MLSSYNMVSHHWANPFESLMQAGKLLQLSFSAHGQRGQLQWSLFLLLIAADSLCIPTYPSSIFCRCNWHVTDTGKWCQFCPNTPLSADTSKGEMSYNFVGKCWQTYLLPKVHPMIVSFPPKVQKRGGTYTTTMIAIMLLGWILMKWMMLLYQHLN